MICGQRGRWSLMLLLLCPLVPTLASCPQGDYLSEKGICCNKCPPGFKLHQDCQAAGQRTSCTVCPDRQYTDQMNFAPNCKSCIRCKESDNKEEVSQCEINQNTVCRCKYGYYKYKIDSETFECLKCKKCGPEETETQTCTSEKNTRCACKENYYRDKDKCEPCNICSPECNHLCPKTTSVKPIVTTTGISTNLFINIIATCVVSAIVLLLLVAVITYVATKRSTKKRMRKESSDPQSISQEPCKVLIADEESCSDHSVQADAQMPLSEQEPSRLPDCVPLEISIPDLIYTVLDLVPVQQVKQLVRTLGVRDVEIEQAELDHRSCQEAHYQMLRAWAERGPQAGRGGRGRIMYRPLLEELLDQLRKIHLGRAAEELETKYGIV